MNSTAADAWRVRDRRFGDEAAFVALFEAAYGRPITEEYWRWKLDTQPSPVENIGLAVSADDRPVFHIGGIPCRFQIGGQLATVMVAVDAMTAPQFRRRGLLTTVGRKTFERWRMAGIAMALGLPNEQYNKSVLGWQTLFPFRWLLRPLRPEALLARRLGVPLLGNARFLRSLWNGLWHRPWCRSGGIAIRELEGAGRELDLLWERCREGIALSMVRDRSWVAWRYFAAPHVQYRVLMAWRGGEPAGYAAYCIRGSGDRRWGMIPEVFAAPRDAPVVRALIDEVVRRLRAADVDGVATLALPGTWLYRAFRRAGFLFSWGAFSVECVPFAPSLRLDQLRDRERWYLAGGDFDVI